MWYIINSIQLVFVVLWSLFCSIAFPIWMVLTFSSRNAVKLVGTVWAPGMFLLTGSRLKLVGRENLDSSKPSVYMSNHMSFLDIPAVSKAVGIPLYFVAKKELKKMPAVGWFIAAVGMIFIDRSNREKAYESLTKAGEMVRGGKNIITFPEGTRSSDGNLLKFRKGSFHLSQAAQVPMVPLYVHGTNKIWPNKSWRFRPGIITVYIGKPIQPEEYQGQSLDEMADSVRLAVQALRTAHTDA